VRSNLEVARLSFAIAILGACAAGCSVYDPDLLSSKGESLDRNDGGSTGEPPPPSVCKVGNDSTVCTRPHADGVCLGGNCTIVRCHEGYSDCDKQTENGCEATLTTSDNCGACGARCGLPNVTHHVCAMGQKGAACGIDDSSGNGCKDGFADCDKNPANGCETSLHTLSNCGACGQTCALDVAEASCDSGKCEFVSCAPGFADCSGVGCQSLTGDKHNCGECDRECGTDAPMCFGGRCTAMTCEGETADCDGKAGNGCETDLTSIDSCGSCTTRCGPYDHATAVCREKLCGIGECEEGFVDCDDVHENGCETDASQPANCGGCGHDCGALPHVMSSTCDAGECSELECEPGWGDCDGDPDTGCEQALNTADDCEQCGQKCQASHGDASCETGTCVLKSCEDGFDDCNDDPGDGCEAAPDSDPGNCGKCGNVCPAGKACRNGGCACKDDSGCSDGATCCDGACIFTDSSCYVWPCIPGTTRDKNNCGGCGVQCLTWCCFP
jgi:hypothetical protein